MEPVGTGTSSMLGGRRAYLPTAAVVGVAILLVWQWEPFVAWLDMPGLLRSIGRVAVKYLPLTVPAVAALVVILILQRVIPAHRSSARARRGLSEDLVWLLLAAPVTTLGAFWFSRGLQWLFDHPLAHARVDLSAYLPFGAVFVICFVVGDLLGWLYHYLKHKVPLFWRFHAVHHSAVHLNPFTDARVHLGEFFITQTVSALPFFLIGGDVTATVTLVVLARLWLARFNHSNIRTHLGPLRHVFVTPQYHRLHHSVEPRDVDRNFGGVFSFWDRMFGTQVTDCNRYPETGINDPDFPTASSQAPLVLVRTYWRQSIYPFRRVAPRFPVSRSLEHS